MTASALPGPAAGGSARPGRRLDPAVPVLGGMLLLGVGSGVLWAFVTPYATVEVTAEGGAFSPAELAQLFGGVAVFALISFVLGLLCGVLAWVALRAARGPLGLVYAVAGAALASAVGMQVADVVVRRRFPPIDPQDPGIYHAAGNLWLTDASLGALPAPWLLLVCAPGVAALAYFIFLAGSGETTVPGAGGDGADARGQSNAHPPPPPGWTYPGAPAAEPPSPAAAFPSPSVPTTPGPLTGADAESRTRP